MNIHIHHQHLNVNHIEVIDISASSNLQLGDNDQVVLYSTLDLPPDSIQCGSFPNPPIENSPFSFAELFAKRMRGLNKRM